VIQSLSAPTDDFERAVSTRIRTEKNTAVSQKTIVQYEDIRLAAALDLGLPVPESLIAADPSKLALIWALSIR
jgi:hypothetical protein